MGGWGGDFILEGGNDCDRAERERDRERKDRAGGAREREAEEMQMKRTKEGNKQRKTEKRKT